MENIKMSFVSLQRILKTSYKLVENNGKIDKYEVNTLKYLISQCNEEQLKHLYKRFGDKLSFLFEEDIHSKDKN